MPGFNLKSCERISRVVRQVESQGVDARTPPTKWHGGEFDRWFLLIEDFDEDGWAAAKFARWYATENDGDGEIAADPIAWTYVRDTIGGSDATEGDWVLCRPIGSENGTVWEIIVVAGGYDRITGLTTAAVTGGNFTIDNVKAIKGRSPLVNPDSISETVAIVNTMAWDADNNAPCFAQWNKNLNGGSGAWEAYQVKCPA